MSIGKINTVLLAGQYAVELEWDDGRRARVDFTDIIGGHKALAALAVPSEFERVALSSDGWSLEWPCGIDFGTTQLRRWSDEQAGEAMPSADFRRWMEMHRLTLDGAAKALGLSRRTIAYYLSGEQPVPKTVMLATIGYGHQQAA